MDKYFQHLIAIGMICILRISHTNFGFGELNCERKALRKRKTRCVIGGANIAQLIKEKGSIGLIEN